MLHGETVQSCLPWDIPWWQPEYAIFFGICYVLTSLIIAGLGVALVKTIRQNRERREKSR